MHRTLALALFFFLAAFTARAAQPHGAWHLSQRDDGRSHGDPRQPQTVGMIQAAAD